MERALSILAERAVTAEARVKTLEVELKVEKWRASQLEGERQNLDLALKQWWLVFWGTFGATPEQLLKFRIETCRETKEEAERLIYGTHGLYQSPGFNPAAPATGVVICDEHGYYQFHQLKRPA